MSVRSYDVSSERVYLYFEESTAKTICLPGPRPVGTFGRCAMANGLSAARTASQPCMARAGLSAPRSRRQRRVGCQKTLDALGWSARSIGIHPLKPGVATTVQRQGSRTLKLPGRRRRAFTRTAIVSNADVSLVLARSRRAARRPTRTRRRHTRLAPSVMSDKKSAANAKTKYGTEYTKVDVESGVSASATGVTRGKKFNPWTSPTAVIGWLVVLVGAYVVYANRSHGAGTSVDAAPSSSPAATEATPAPSAVHYATPEPIDLTKPIPEATGDIRADIASGATNLPFGELEDEPDFRVHKTNNPNDPYDPWPPAPEVRLAEKPPAPEVVLAALGDAAERAW